MSDFGKPQPCRNNCGAYIYFDKDSEIGHPAPDKWIPLVYENDTGLRTNTAHQCPKSTYIKSQQQQPQSQQPQRLETQPASGSNNNPIPLLRILEAKLDRVILLLEKQTHVQG